MKKRDFLAMLAVAPVAATASEVARAELKGWQPIETAPRDRPVLILADKKIGSIAEFGQRIAVGQFYDEWSHINGHKSLDFRIYTSYHGERPVDVLVPASHWMELPEVP